MIALGWRVRYMPSVPGSRLATSASSSKARLLVAFRDHLKQDWPPEDAMLASVERLIGDPDTEYLLAASTPGEPPAGLVQLRYRWSVWRDSEDCLLEDLFVD